MKIDISPLEKEVKDKTLLKQFISDLQVIEDNNIYHIFSKFKTIDNFNSGVVIYSKQSDKYCIICDIRFKLNGKEYFFTKNLNYFKVLHLRNLKLRLDLPKNIFKTRWGFKNHNTEIERYRVEILNFLINEISKAIAEDIITENNMILFEYEL